MTLKVFSNEQASQKRSAAIISADFSANFTITGQLIYLSPLCYAVEAHLLCARANRRSSSQW